MRRGRQVELALENRSVHVENDRDGLGFPLALDLGFGFIDIFDVAGNADVLVGYVAHLRNDTMCRRRLMESRTVEIRISIRTDINENLIFWSFRKITDGPDTLLLTNDFMVLIYKLFTIAALFVGGNYFFYDRVTGNILF